jgi:glyoxylase-like metal-dependent hydrolase (beta-lactamase superfamily II)
MFTIHPIRLGKGVRSKSMYTYLTYYDDKCLSFYGVYLIRGKNHNVLVDTGVNSEEYAKFSDHSFQDVKTLTEGLQEFGLDKDNIDFIIQTHLHFDHSAFLKEFPGAKKYLQKKEWDYSHNPHPLFEKLYYRPYFADVAFELIDGDKTLLPGLEVILVPGHSPGCQAVLVETENGKVAITGFCCIKDNFLQDSQEEKIIIPTYHENPVLAYESMRKIKRIADYVYPSHQAELVKVSIGGI